MSTFSLFRKIRQKKGATDLQFHWIFVLIAGVLIIMFFILIVGAVRKTETTKLGIDMVKSIDAIFTGSSVQEYTSKIVESSRPMTLQFSCTVEYVGGASRPLIDASYGIVYPQVSATNNYLAIFAPAQVQGETFTIYSQPLNFPFRIDRLLYVASPTVQFILLDDARELSTIFPTNFTVREFSDLSDYLGSQQASSSAKTIIIVSKQDPSLSQGLTTEVAKMGARATILYKKVDTDLKQIDMYVWSQREREFDRGGDLGRVMPYYNDALLLGAIFTQDTITYQCMLERLFDRLTVVSYFYEKRYQNTAVPPLCTLLYADAISAVQGLQSGTSFQSSEDVLIPARDQLERARALVEERSCPALY